ncbi:serine/threonine-protein kinase [Streptomyces sp. W16]|uniref:serine/threonine-protein kinase n=1 Tax=Streptomyces sp. W16 TaxID=3076631 RepID=UPI00295A75DC|nr:serine/threonine-protein kinase [Streptomyces sp. W16]MDV9173274.1 serine/threonine-protein kinase [Streptomyces sp. W16]
MGEPIADGGWGWVYEGRSVRGTDDPAVVALKFLPTSGLAPRQARGLLECAHREVEFGRRARHPRLIRVLDSLVLNEPDHAELDGAIVLVMERAERSLRQLLGCEAGLADGQAERILTQICEGLAHLHDLGWVHGDLKPDNVLLMADGAVRLSDFGLAAELDGTHGTHGWIPPLGTPDYLPPERWKAPLGERGVQARPSADIWALGIMVHQMFTGGTSPFPGATPAARGAAAQEYAGGRAPLRLDPAVPPFWRDLATDCLAPTHEARAACTAELLLARIGASGHGDSAAAGGTGAARARGDRRRRRVALGAAAATALCAATVAGWVYVADDNSATGDRPVHAENVSDTAGPAAITVYNVEPTCRAHAADRDQQCSLGLAIDPLAPYTVDNVVATRVWHGDVLMAQCRLPQGLPVTDEFSTRSTQWYRVRLPGGAADATAWFPAVRTKDRPALPTCR